MSCRTLTLAVACVTLLPVLACSVDVHEEEQGGKASVDIRTPVGDVSVRTDVDDPDTGLPVYPGSWPLRDGDEPRSANVDVGSAWFGVKVVAAKFESGDAEEKVVDFYRNALQKYGDVTECRGNVDFKGRSGARRPVCRDRPFSDDVQLVAGTEERHRIVDVKRRGKGSEFALVYIETRGES